MNKYDVKRTCGEGSFAVVYEAVRRSDGVRVAVKKIKTPQPSWQACLHLRELRSFKTVGSHPHVVALLELVLEKKLLHFVFEFCDSNLYEFLSASSSPLPPARAAEMLAQLLSGVGHIHAHGFMHRDLKPENVLCDAAATHLKVADLGLARELRSRPPYTDYIATRWYRAPENVLRAQQYGPQIDVWALGCIGAELLTRKPLLPGASDADMWSKMVALLGPLDGSWDEGAALARRHGLRPPAGGAPTLPQLLPPGDGANLVRDLLAWNPRRRPTCRTALGHPFVKGTAAARLPTFNARGSSSTASAVTAAPPAVAAATPLARVSSAAAALSPPKPSAPTRPPALSPVKSSPARIVAAADGKRPWPITAAGAAGSPVAREPSTEGELRSLWRKFDQDRSGALDVWEFGLLLSHLGLLHHHCKQTASARGSASDEEIEKWFRKLDLDGSGTIEWNELRTWWFAEGEAAARAAAAAVSGRSSNGRPSGGGASGRPSGGGTLDERMAARSGGANGGSGDAAWEAEKALLREIFFSHDIDGDGEIDARELTPLLVKLGVITCAGGEEEMDEMSKTTALEMDQLMAEMEMAEIDADGNGSCSFDEICAWWRRHGHKMPAALGKMQAAVRGAQTRRELQELRELEAELALLDDI